MSTRPRVSIERLPHIASLQTDGQVCPVGRSCQDRPRPASGTSASRCSPRCGSGFRAESTQRINDEADHQNETDAAAAVRGTAKVKAATAEQEEQNKDEYYRIHADTIVPCRNRAYGVFTPSATHCPRLKSSITSGGPDFRTSCFPTSLVPVENSRLFGAGGFPLPAASWKLTLRADETSA